MTMRTRHGARRILSSALLLAVLVCAGSAPAKETEPDFVWLTYVPFTLDPALGTGQVERRVIECVYEGLVRLDGERYF